MPIRFRSPLDALFRNPRFAASGGAWRRPALVVVTLLASIVVGALTPVLAAAAAPAFAYPNQWLGLRADGGRGASATCALGGSASADRSVSTWVAVGGTAFLDVIQIGAMATPAGRHFFAAYGRGEPGRPGSLYVERNLGPADSLPHTYELRLDGSSWTLAIDGTARLVVDDGFRTWHMRSVQVMTEAEGARDMIGGIDQDPVRCRDARAYMRTWTRPAWMLTGFGPSAASALIDQGLDRFSAVRNP